MKVTAKRMYSLLQIWKKIFANETTDVIKFGREVFKLNNRKTNSSVKKMRQIS